MISKAEFCNYIKEYENVMYITAYSILKNDHDAADAIGEAILKAYSNLNNLKDPKVFRSWILRIVHNEAVSLIRKNRPVTELENARHITDGDNETKRTEKMDLKEAVENLPQPYRTVITLYYYQSLSMDDIAGITGTSALTVRKQLSRGRKMLRTMLKEDFLHE